MTPKEQTQLVLQTLSKDWQCDPAIFLLARNTIVPSTDKLFEIVSFGYGAAIRAMEPMLTWCRDNLSDMDANLIMDSEMLFAIETKLRTVSAQLCGEHMRYLHLQAIPPPPAPGGMRYVLLSGSEVQKLYDHRAFDNALGFHGRDVLALCAYAGDVIVGMAAADDLLDPLWQIGIDVMPGYRNRGLASFLVHTITEEIYKAGKLPYYTTWGANLASTRVALSCGFRPAWINYYAQPCDAQA